MQSSFRPSPEPPYLVRPSFTPSFLSHPFPYLPLVWPDRTTLSYLVLLFMNNIFSQKFYKYFSSYIFSHFEIYIYIYIYIYIFIQEHYIYHLFNTQRTFNKTKNTHIFSLYKNIIFIFFNLYPLVSWEKNSNTDLNIGVSLVS